jgi:hypothetical protein
MKRCWPWLVLVGALGVGAWLLLKFVPLPIPVSAGYDPTDAPMSYAVSIVVKDDRPAFSIDPNNAWVIEFGRGSGWQGLNTAKLDQDGHLLLHRLRMERQGNPFISGWETTTAELPSGAVAEVLESVKANRLMELDKAYHAAVCDGTQWVLWIRQGEREKAVYFDNHFPTPIVRFAERFDAIVSGSVGPALRWQAVPSARVRDHERELWESIKR